MNKERKNKIKTIINQLREASDELIDINDDECQARERIPENLQGGGSYCVSEECSDKIEDAIDEIQSAANTLEEI